MFLKILSKSVLLLGILVIIVDIIYPLALWIVGQILFPFQANGSILYNEAHQAIGSTLIAQAFTKDEYFHPRPSACDYDASASASSALAPSNPALRDRVTKVLVPLIKYQQAHPGAVLQNVPADLVTTSASGLDPHISLQNAEYQLTRVANKWASLLNRDPRDIQQEIEKTLQANAHAPFGGLAGEKLINVLEVNLELNKHFSIK